MTIESGIAFLLAVFIFSVTPGPGVFAILARAISRGSTACIPLALGMTISDILYLIAACFGLATIAVHWGEFFTVVRIAGGLYLIYLGWKIWTAPIEPMVEEAQSKRSRHALGFTQGFMISASNPKVILFYIAFLPTFMDVTALSSGDIVIATLLTFVGLMAGLMLIALTAAKARLYFKSESATKRLNRGAGSIMMGAGAFLIARD